MQTTRRVAGWGVALALALAGCGASSGAFGWLRPAETPAGWTVARIASGAAMSYPPGWRRIKGDPGTASAATFDADDRFVGYLNVTPRQSSETLANWAHFRVAHNAQEGERDIRTLAAATGLRFRSGAGSCVRDSYATSARTRYIEIACLVTGSRASTVIVGATPPQHWTAIGPLIERAISAFQP